MQILKKGAGYSVPITLALCLLAGCLTTDHYVKPKADFSQFKQAAVLPFRSPPEIAKERATGVCEGVADIVATQLLKKGWDVVERSRVEAILEERDMRLGELPAADDLNEVRKLLAVDCFVTGAVTEWREFVAFRNDGAVGITLKLYDAQTGQLLWSGSGNSTVTLFDDKRQSNHAQKIVTRLCSKIPSL